MARSSNLPTCYASNFVGIISGLLTPPGTKLFWPWPTCQRTTTWSHCISSSWRSVTRSKMRCSCIFKIMCNVGNRRVTRSSAKWSGIIWTRRRVNVIFNNVKDAESEVWPMPSQSKKRKLVIVTNGCERVLALVETIAISSTTRTRKDPKEEEVHQTDGKGHRNVTEAANPDLGIAKAQKEAPHHRAKQKDPRVHCTRRANATEVKIAIFGTHPFAGISNVEIAPRVTSASSSTPRVRTARKMRTLTRSRSRRGKTNRSPRRRSQKRRPSDKMSTKRPGVTLGERH